MLTWGACSRWTLRGLQGSLLMLLLLSLGYSQGCLFLFSSLPGSILPFSWTHGIGCVWAPAPCAPFLPPSAPSWPSTFPAGASAPSWESCRWAAFCCSGDTLNSTRRLLGPLISHLSSPTSLGWSHEVTRLSRDLVAGDADVSLLWVTAWTTSRFQSQLSWECLHVLTSVLFCFVFWR